MIPALDPTAFEDLVEDLGSYTVASEFMTSFDSLLTGRIQRIERALENHDKEEIVTALLSLQASAAMAGAAQLQASVTRALVDQSVELVPPGALIRELHGQADLFRIAFADHHSRPTPPIGSPSFGKSV